jgi:sugar phosphate permease
MIIEERFSRSTAMAGVASSLFDWIGFGGVVIAGIVSDRWAKSLRTPVIFIMSAGMLLSIILLAQVNEQDMFVWFLVFLGLTGFMLYGPDSLLSGTAAMDVGTPAMAVMASGVINGLGSIGPIVQEEVIGYVKTYYGLDAVFNLFIFVAALGVLGTGLLWFINHRLGTRL